MATIYQLTQEQRQLLDAIFWDEEDIESINRLDSIGKEISSKLAYVSSIYAEAMAHTVVAKAALDEARDRLDKQYKAALRTELRLKDFIRNSMINSGIRKINGDIVNVTVVDHNKMVITDNAVLPDDCYEIITETKILKKVVLDHVKNGEEIEGVYMVSEPYLRVN